MAPKTDSAPSMSFFEPFFWPLTNLRVVLSHPPKTLPPITPAKGVLHFWDNMTTFAAALRSFMVACFCILVLHSSENPYPAFGPAKTISLSWILPMVIRNMIGTIIFCYAWDWFLLKSPWADVLTPYKFKQEIPSDTQIYHDAYWTMLASIQAAIFVEAPLCYGWANGYLPMSRNLMDAPLWNFGWAMFITHWRIPHFWFIHRIMHPWKFNIGPDIGKLLYRYVHSLHHRSYNTTACSGTSMHPVEATTYYTACLVAVPFGVHPTIILGCIVDCAMGAWFGHDGFRWPGLGDYFHHLHHLHFDCNYGGAQIPLDWCFGSYISKRDDMKKVWGKKKVGRKENEKIAKVHDQGKILDEKEA